MPNNDLTACKIRLTGIVQGVGFRPYIYRMAEKNKLKGYVKNTGGAEVEIWVEGKGSHLKKFLVDLRGKKPSVAVIEEIRFEKVKPRLYKYFSILKSSREASFYSMVPPDIGICEGCLEEIMEPGSRWYMYPFNSCAWCGPRFTMMKKTPYDRENTAMVDFPLCSHCKDEYSDPRDIRRFHAQGISCKECGPKVFLLDRLGRGIETKNALYEAAKLIDEGKIVAVKGLGGFHIAALATEDDVVLKLRERKRRPQKPFALMALNLETAKEILCLNKAQEKLLLSPEKPIVIALKRRDSAVSRYVAPQLKTLGVMLPYTGLHYLLLNQTRDKFLIMTSGNARDKPICKSNREALKLLNGFVDYFLMHNRRILNRCDDSVIRFTDGHPFFLRRSRGYAPTWINVNFKFDRPVIAFGADLSNVAALAFKNHIVPTQYLGDMDEYDNLLYLEEALDFLLKTYNIRVEDSIIACDNHPGYLSSRLAYEWAEKHSCPLVKIQHHHAHMASAIAEHKLDPLEKIIAITMDGAGYGEDGSVWGGEVLIGSCSNYERRGQLRYQPMLGGDLATKYPVRMLIGILSTFLDTAEIRGIILKHKLDRGLRHGLKELNVALKHRGNSPLTSSTGRLLDAFSALLNICLIRNYEGEPAIKLEEEAVNGRIIDDVRAPVRRVDETYVVDTTNMFKDVIGLIDTHSVSSIAYTVLKEIGRAFGYMASRCLKRNMDKVVVSGGAAVNNYLIQGIKEALIQRGVKLILKAKLPPGDGGISTGQAMVAGVKFNEHLI